MKNKMTKINKGMATIELLVAFAILLINITSVLLLVQGGQSLSLDSETNQEALAKAQQQIEKAKSDGNLDFNLVYESSSIVEDIYTKKLDVQSGSYDDPNTDMDERLFTKLVTSLVNWNVMANKPLQVKLSTLITNPEGIEGGDTCSSVLAGDWSEPEIVTYKYKKQGSNYNFDTICRNGLRDDNGSNCENGYEFGTDILGDTSSGFPITSIQTFNHKMYVTANNTNGNNDSNFFILDISNTPDIKPVTSILGSLDNIPPSVNNALDGLNAVAIDNRGYAYVASAFDTAPANCTAGEADCAQLQVIKLNCIASECEPEVVKNMKIPSVTTSGYLAHGTSIFYKKGIVYLGLVQADGYIDNSDPDNPITYPGYEFVVIDVGGNNPSNSPLNPEIIYEKKVHYKVNSILVKDDYAYVATPDGLASNDAKELWIFNVNDLDNITEAGSFDAQNNQGHGKSMYIVGNKLYLGRTYMTKGNPDDDYEFYILNNSNPESNLGDLGFENIYLGGDDNNDSTSVNGLLVRSNLAFLVTTEDFLTYDISNPFDITPYAQPLELPGPGGVQGTANDCEENYIYVGSDGSDDKGYISIITGGPENEE